MEAVLAVGRPLERAHRPVDQRLVVAARDRPPPLVGLGHQRQPHAQERGLELVETAIDTVLDVAIAVGLAVLAYQAQAVGQVRIARHDGAAIAQCPEVLRRIERERAERAQGSGGAAAPGRAHRLRAVLDHRQTDLEHRAQVRDLAIEMDRHDGARALRESAPQ